jgi:hypothetical protein
MSEEQFYFDRVIQSGRFPLLKRCTLRGIRTYEAALLTFLRQRQLNGLEMEEVHLRHPGEFRLNLDYLVKDTEQLDYLHLNDLWEKRLHYFDAPREPHFPSSEPQVGPNTLTRTGVDVRMPIKYQHMRGSNLQTPECWQWARKRQMKYGLPFLYTW